VRARERYPARSAAYTLWPRCYGIATRTSAHAPHHPPSCTHVLVFAPRAPPTNKENSRACAKGAPYYSSVVSPPPRHHNTTTRYRNDLPLLLYSWCKLNSDRERRHSGNNSSSNGNIPAHRTAAGKRDRATTTSVGHVRGNCIARNFARMTRATDVARVAHFIALFDAKATLSSFVRCATGSPTYYCSCSCCCVRKSHSIARKLNIMILFSRQHYILQIALIW